MALRHIHNSGKHVNKKAADNFKIKTRSGEKKTELKSLSYTAENTNFESKMSLCRDLCFSN